MADRAAGLGVRAQIGWQAPAGVAVGAAKIWGWPQIAGGAPSFKTFLRLRVPSGNVTGNELGRAGMLMEFGGLSTPLVADACVRTGVPLRVAPPGIGAVVPG